MLEILLDIFLDALKDTAILIPFLFLTYLLMEYIEHKASDKIVGLVEKSGKLGPLIGGTLGLVPQCGFSSAATALYTGRIITIGTLISIYLTTSDEMLPILISSQIPIYKILIILAIKFVVGVIVGFIVDFVYSRYIIKKSDNNKEKLQENISAICEGDHCHCDNENIFLSSLKHTLSIALFIFIVTFVINGIIEFIGQDFLINLFNSNKILGPILASLIGLIPNCASSVVLTSMYVDNIISAATLISGLLVNSGIGVLILFKINHNLKENIKITSILFVTGVIVGIVLNLFNFAI